MIIMLLLYLVLPTVTAFLILCKLWPDKAGWASDLILKLSVSLAAGVGISSLLFFVWTLCFTPSGTQMVPIESTLLVVGIGTMVYSLRRSRFNSRVKSQPEVLAKPEELSPPLPPKWLWMGLAGSVSLAGFQFVNLLFRYPHGLWDGWAIWNLRAKFLVRSAENWHNTFSSHLYWSSPDHPLMIPGIVAQGWKYIGSESVLIPMVVASIFFVATIVALSAFTSKMRGSHFSILAVLCLVGSPNFLLQSASQYADVPVSFFIMTSVAFLILYDTQSPHKPGWLLFAGSMAAMAAWTKNEGWLLIVAIIFSRIVLGVLSHKIYIIFKELRQLLVGAAPVIVIVIIFKIFLAPPSGLFAGQEPSTIIGKLTDLSRYELILKSFSNQMFFFGDGIAIGMIILILFIGLDINKLKQNAVISSLLILGIMLMGYFTIYLITPQNLAWHINTSLYRLLMQIWPLTILIFCMVVTTPKRTPACKTKVLH